MNDFINELGVIIYATLLFTPPPPHAEGRFCQIPQVNYRHSNMPVRFPPKCADFLQTT